jgi:FAD/FMN-containing dehydrogenase
VLQRRSQVSADNTGYDLAALFVGSEGTLGVITAVDLRVHPVPLHRVTALCGFDDLDPLIAAGRIFRDVDTIAALELIDGRAARLTADRLGVPAPVRADWLLLVELAGDTDQTGRLAALIDDAAPAAEPAVGVDPIAQQRIWQLRDSLTEAMGTFGPPLKFDVSLPLSAIAKFTAEAEALTTAHSPEAVAMIFGHVGEGNLHLNVLHCQPDQEGALDGAMMELVAAHGGNVSSEHGVGSRKRPYLPMSRHAADIAAMRTIKAAFDPTGYLNPAVLFDSRR